MSQSFYDASIPWLLHAMDSLSNVLEKGSAHCEKEKIDPAAFLAARLYPDMFPLTRQVQIVSDQVKGGAARLAGIEPPKFADTEASFADLRARLSNTATFLRGLDKARVESAGDRLIEVKFPQRTLNFPSGWNYLLSYVYPNVYFHSVTAYDILRHGGVKIGKLDFLGAIPIKLN